jgi:hypothetical protein
MIEPSDTNIRPQKPISLDRCPLGPWLLLLTVVTIVHPIIMPSSAKPAKPLVRPLRSPVSKCLLSGSRVLL